MCVCIEEEHEVEQSSMLITAQASLAENPFEEMLPESLKPPISTLLNQKCGHVTTASTSSLHARRRASKAPWLFFMSGEVLD
jgi:hypothetical protein